MIKNKTNFHFQRYELKYILPGNFADIIVPELLKHMEWDPFIAHKEDKSYQVNSLYFDSDDYCSFFEKINGFKKRKKLRIRYYGDKFDPEKLIYLEIKRKYDSVIIKDRIKYPFEKISNIYKITNFTNEIEGMEAYEKDTFTEFLLTLRLKDMKPKLFVSYLRRPLMGILNKNLRITLDSHIKACEAKNFEMVFTPQNVLSKMLIVEVKYNNILPGWFHKIIQKYSLDRTSYSKYTNGLIACKPDSKLIFNIS